MLPSKGKETGEGKPLEAALGCGRLQRKQRLDGSHDVICCPRSPSCPHNRCDCSGWASYRGAGDKERKAPSQEGGHPGTGRSPAQPPGGSNLAGRGAGEQAPQRGGAQAAHGDLGEIPHSLCGSVIHFALPLTRATRHEARHRSVTAGVSPTAPGCRKRPPSPPLWAGQSGLWSGRLPPGERMLFCLQTPSPSLAQTFITVAALEDPTLLHSSSVSAVSSLITTSLKPAQMRPWPPTQPAPPASAINLPAP